jgi:hypothetical protein
MLSASVSSTSILLRASLPLVVDLGLETGVPSGEKLSSGLAAVLTFGGVPTMMLSNEM